MTKSLRYIALLLLALLPAFNAFALTKDNEDGCYVIASAADFIEFSNNTSFWSKNIKQIYDIDLEGAVITPVGNGKNPFTGSYDGRGKTISNAKILWNDGEDANHSVFGLFGAINGKIENNVTKFAKVCNLNLDNITVTRNSDESYTSGIDLRIGVLAGYINQYVTIYDISITNSKITDGGTNPNPKGVYCGGVFGDMASAVGGTSELSLIDGFVLKNIFCNVDFDFRNTTITCTDKVNQLYVGGIGGRIRNINDLGLIPDNTIYKGTMIVPNGSESPTVSNIRSGLGLDTGTAVRLYAGEIKIDSKNYIIGEIGDGKLFPTEADYNAFCSSRLFFDYSAYNSASSASVFDDKIEKITASYPAASDNKLYKMRTFSDSKNKTPKVGGTGTNYSQSDWAMLQGVNFGTCKSADSDADVESMKAKLEVLDKDSSGDDIYEWVWNSSSSTFSLKLIREIEPIELFIDANDEGTEYIARFFYKNFNLEYLDYSSLGTFQWYYSDDPASGAWGEVDSSNSPTIVPNSSYYYYVTWTHGDITLTSSYRAPKHLVYVYNRQNTIDYQNEFKVPEDERFDTDYYTQDGVDERNFGATPQNPVKTMKRAYEIISEFGGVNTNRIVVMGYLQDNEFLQKISVDKKLADSPDYCRAATVTGTDNKEIFNGRLGFSVSNSVEAEGGYLFFNLTAPLVLENIYLHNRAPSNITHITFYCNLFDLTIGSNVKIIDFPQTDQNMGLPADIQSLPRFTLIAGFHNYNSADPLPLPKDIYPGRTAYYKDPDRANIVINSGVFGRIICANRNNGNNTISKNICGNPQAPVRVAMTINIPSDINLDKDSPDYRLHSQYGLKTDKNKNFVSAEYTHNIGLISGGQTDGSVYGDIELNIYSGYIGRVISGNISFGRIVDKNYPTDSFFGRSVINIYGKSSIDADSKSVNGYKVTSETTINEMVGGILGRVNDADNGIFPYFYGESVVNMYGGFIGRYTGDSPSSGSLKTQIDNLKKIEPSLYGAGSGGTAGIGDSYHHTNDPNIPYYDASGKLRYGSYEAATADGCSIPVMTMHDGDIIDLRHTSCAVNLYSGIIESSVYGGGYGYSNNISKDYYQKFVGYDDGICLPGVVFGNSKVSMLSTPEYQPAVVLGNIYGGGAGNDFYANQWIEDNPTKDPSLNPFREVASQYGDCMVELKAGTVGNIYDSSGGDVYGGSKGIEGYPDMATTFGKVTLDIDGPTIYGNIFGGSNVAAIKHRQIDDSGNIAPGSGSTYLTVSSGVIGNNIFGGSHGSLGSAETKAIIEGSTNVEILGGDFLDTPFKNLHQVVSKVDGKPDINIVDNRDLYRTFNIYGGGYLNCDVKGNANLNVYSSLLASEGSILDPKQNPNADSADDVSWFQSAYMDITYRCFCVYGGGFGEKTNVLNTNVYVTIPKDRQHVEMPNGKTLTRFLDHQSFFDIAGGGYSGDIGYWTKADGTRVTSESAPEDYQKYVGGNCKVTIDDYTFARKVIGGGFYGACNNTNTHVRCGSIRQVYGGSLLGDVHQRAYLQFGNRIEDFVRWSADDNRYYFSEHDEFEPYRGDKDFVTAHWPEVWADAAAFAQELNSNIYITENIYGGNDVKGIIGTKKWEAPKSDPSEAPVYAMVPGDNAPLFCTNDGSTLEDCGIVFNIYGGTFMGDVYGAGNGHYRGYYVPEWVRYSDGSERMYRKVRSGVSGVASDGLVYRSRPMVGNVNINIRGNSPTDQIHFMENFYGGGRECTIGQWNTFLPVEDPRRLIKGGHLHVNIGGYANFDGNVYLGSEGNLYASQPTVPKEVTDFNIYTTADSKKTENINDLGDIAYYHWYYDTEKSRYLPGFPAPGKLDGNFDMCGEHMFRAYLKNIEMECDVELTFYRNLYERDDQGAFLYEEKEGAQLVDDYGTPLRKRRRWIPYEKAVADAPDSETTSISYDAPSITMTSFFLGGACGSMSNNTVMDYNGDDDEGNPIYEEWPSIYRVSLPKGVLIKDAVVMGSQDAQIDAYKYDDADCRTITKNEDNMLYSYKGGMVTHSTLAFDLIVYNDVNYSDPDTPLRDLPADFYTNTSNSDYTDILKMSSYTIVNGADAGTDISRKAYANDNDRLTTGIGGQNISDERYNLAVISSTDKAYIGPRAMRKGKSDHLTVVKLGASCQFEPQIYDPHGSLPATASDDEKHAYRYGGIIYGGCYNSGITIGDVILNVASNMLGDHYKLNSQKAYDEYSRLRYNKGRVFGGGFGENTEVQGNTYVNLINEFRGMNVFGGGMQGNVTGTAYVTYMGKETTSFIYGAIYGGGLKGSVGTKDGPDATAQATVVRLFSGNVDEVYGGSCMGDLYGRAHVELADEVKFDIDHLDYERLRDKGYNWTTSRLIAGTVYGGNDISGNIYPLAGASASAITPSPIYENYSDFTTSVYVHEEQSTDAGKDTPGHFDGYNGFPLIGSVYGGSNGQYGVHDSPGADGAVKSYKSGEVVIATGFKTDSISISLASLDVPNVDNSKVDIEGGSIIDAYTGGNMATITRRGVIHVNYEERTARAGFETMEELDRVWNALHLSAEEQRDEVIELDDDGFPVFQFNILRLFGGNNNADMAIQPEVDLQRGDLGSVYSGGNFGKMTFYQPHVDAVAADPSANPPVVAKPEVPEKGLTLTIDSDDISIENLYGGGRVGDIIPEEVVTVTETSTDPVTGAETSTTSTVRQQVSSPGTDFYGATLNVERGIIYHVYGGNDVAGYVDRGTHVSLHGAISGDVYCAGNGNYAYKYDRSAQICDYNLSQPRIVEDYEYKTDDTKGSRYFVLPASEDYGYVNGSAYDPSDAQVIMAINSYRPHVERAKLSIKGTEDRIVWVGGKVYCGGNSATVTKRDAESNDCGVIFELGEYVRLNGVFLGSNGESLAIGSAIKKTEILNGKDNNTPLNMTGVNDLTKPQLANSVDHSVVDYKERLYPSVLDLYMRAVETSELPEIRYSSDLTDAFVGVFCVGGNRGSMMTDKKISLDFRPELTIFGHIIGGSMDANVSYENDISAATHIGGLTMPLAATEGSVKLDMKVRSSFRPLSIKFPDTSTTPPISINNTVVGSDGNEYTSGDKYYPDQQCNIYGGCFTSGTTEGGINIDLYSDMLNYECSDSSDPKYVDKRAVINGITDSRSWRSFTVVGGGYGAHTAVYGNINVNMLPHVDGEGETRTVSHPSAASIFGGSEEGLVVGNTKVEIRDGKVLANVYGASESAKMYGSTAVIVGYPKYYKAKKTGNYRLKRVDYMSEVSRSDLKDEFDEVVVPKTVAYFEGDIVPKNVYDVINGRVKNARINSVIGTKLFRVGKNVDDKYVDKVTLDSSTSYPGDDLSSRSEDDTPRTYYIGDLFEPVQSSVVDASGNPVYDHIVPQDFGATWDDITIWIGDQTSNNDPDGEYYGQGNVYGGGYVPNTSDHTIVGQPTVMRFTNDYNLGLVSEFSSESQEKQAMVMALYGGNTAVMIWDDESCAKINNTTGEYTYSESQVKEHVSVGSGYFKEVTLQPNSSVKGYFEKVEKEFDDGASGTIKESAYVYLTSGKAVSGKKYYEKMADGGVYGGGRKVFAQALRSIDLAYYGYAEHTPQQPKLLNTIQRADIATVTDCCMELVGASDFTINDPKGIYYAINRVGELRMISSLLPDFSLDQGYEDDQDGIRIHAKKRSRNYMALYNKTNHLGAFYSNWTFEQKYHLESGQVTDKDEDSSYGYPKDGKESYVNHKHRFIDFYNGYARLQNLMDKREDENSIPFTKADVDAIIDTYKKFTGKTFTYTSQTAELDLADYLEAIGSLMRDEFAKRNVGTSGNMIGISSGYELSFEGLACQRGEKDETKYYGPAYGVTEMKLLTTVSAMGGGYVYALNHHYDPAVNDYSDGVETPGWCSKFNGGKQDFLQTTGNFVFPGAAYHASDGEKHNYIIDDCFDFFDINHGYYQCDYHARDIIRSRSESDPNINEPHEVHYWYVSGNTYVFNVTITAITSDSEKQFFLSNDNDRVNLFNVKKDTEIFVNQVNWFAHNDIDNDACDIVNMEKKYKLYLSIGSDPMNELQENSTDKNGTYVIRIPRFTYEMGKDSETGKYVNSIVGGNKEDFYDVPEGNRIIDPNYYLNAAVNNNRYGYDASNNEVADIKPRLGLRLVDAEFNRYADMGKEWSTNYFNNHLKPDHMLQVVLETKNPGKTAGSYSESIYFVINIDIKYLMGPAVYGNINIENCALPGEYIYVNANDIEVVMDDNLGVSEQKWRLYPNTPDGNRYPNPDYKADYTADLYPKLDAEIAQSKDLFYKMDTPEFTMAESERVVHIPAYLYRNGWEPVYAVTANGEDFECKLPFYKQVLNQETNQMEDDTSQPIPENRLQVHNYHRMKPISKGSVLDLRLTKDARIYIENDVDMKYFFEYLDMMQTSAAPTSYSRFVTPDGKTVNPQFCDGLNFYLQNDVILPASSSLTIVNSPMSFKGNLHGNGHRMDIKDYNIVAKNEGCIYNCGFLLDNTEGAVLFDDNSGGKIFNCYYFNPSEKGALATNGTLKNCYQNTPAALGFKYNELMKISTLGFRYGQVAYNLNGYYLQKRHILLHNADADNNPYALQAKDSELRLEAFLNPEVTYDRYAVEYVENMFNNGDYRYAFVYDKLNPKYSQFTEALRTDTVPNYFDRLSQRSNGLPVSMHRYTHDVDTKRWCDNHKEYHPIFDTDYLFFGEELNVDVDDANDYLPEAYSPDNRVYRVGGYYGSAADKGYFMNRNAYLDTPLMTAIDFVGYRDRDIYEEIGTTGKSYGPNGAHGTLKTSVRNSIDSGTGWIIDAGWHEVFMPPTLDIPWTWTADDGSDLAHDFAQFRVNSEKVTHNLLIYTDDVPEAYTALAHFHYQDDVENATKVDEHWFAMHPEDGISGHHIIDFPDGPKVYNEYFHLVDNHDFNAPVAFDVKQAWYNRKPTEYASFYTLEDASKTKVYKTGWEGVCLPFDVKKVFAASTDITYMPDMGEITHFFGDEWKGHEYWLRRFEDVADDGDLLFERPTADNMSDVNGHGTDVVDTYRYTNDQIYRLYEGLGYDKPNVEDYTHDLLYHFDDPNQQYRTINDYRYLSRSIPYIVAYPGKSYYEFDLSGEFYAEKANKVNIVPQTICYLAKGDNSDSYIEIPITDWVAGHNEGSPQMAEYSHKGYTMKGTFMHVTDDEDLAKSVLYNEESHLAVLDAYNPVTKEDVHNSTAFVAQNDKMVVMPFHTYVVGDSPISSPMLIGSRDGITVNDIVVDDEPVDEPELTDEPVDGIRVWTEGDKLVIYTPHALETNIYNMSGQLVRRIRAYEGTNRYSGLLPGFYIVLRHKFYIPH